MDLERHDGSFVVIPNLIYAQQMYSKCESVDDMNVDYEQCGKHTHVFFCKTPQVNVLIISGSLDHSRTRFLPYHTILADTTPSFCTAIFWK